MSLPHTTGEPDWLWPTTQEGPGGIPTLYIQEGGDLEQCQIAPSLSETQAGLAGHVGPGDTASRSRAKAGSPAQGRGGGLQGGSESRRALRAPHGHVPHSHTGPWI